MLLSVLNIVNPKLEPFLLQLYLLQLSLLNILPIYYNVETVIKFVLNYVQSRDPNKRELTGKLQYRILISVTTRKLKYPKNYSLKYIQWH